MNESDKQGIIYPTRWQTQLLHKDNSFSFDGFGIVLFSNFTCPRIFLNFFHCHVERSIKYLLKFSICRVSNTIFKLVEAKLMIRIVSSSEGNNIFVIAFVFLRLK